MECTKDNVQRIAKQLMLQALKMPAGDQSSVAQLMKNCGIEANSDGIKDCIDKIVETFLDLSHVEGDHLLSVAGYDYLAHDLANKQDSQDSLVRRQPPPATDNTKAQLNKLIQASFGIGGCFQGYQEILFRKNDDGTWTRNTGKSSSSCPSAGDPVDGEEMDMLKAVLYKSGALTWEDDYWAPVFDGTHWHLQLLFDDESYFESKGSNSYPKDFNVLVCGFIGLGLGG